MRAELLERLRHHAQNTPNRVAFILVDSSGNEIQKTWSEFFLEFYSQFLRLSDLLKKQANTPIALTAAGNSYPHLLWITSAWCAGVPICLLNPSDSKQRQDLQMKALGHDVVWLHSSTVQVSIDQREFKIEKVRQSPQLQQEVSAEVMNMIFTSGSTGHSKIVEQRESEVFSNLRAVCEHHQLNESSVLATSLPLYHVNALCMSLLSTLWNGGTLVLFEVWNPILFVDRILKFRVSIANIVPHMVPHLLIQVLKHEHELLNSSFEYFLSAAAPLQPSLIKKWTEKTSLRILQGYGMSEAVNFTCTMPRGLSREQYELWMTGYERPSVGIPLHDQWIEIVNSNGSKVTEGEKGEIFVQGASVMKGYRQESVQPFSQYGLATGDIGFWRWDHEKKQRFYFVSGRKKEVIKRRGETVSLLEVDETSKKIAVEYDVMAVGVTDPQGFEELAFVVQVESQTEDLSVIIDMLKSQLPVEFHPKYIAFTCLRIRTSSGKAQRWKWKQTLDSKIRKSDIGLWNNLGIFDVLLLDSQINN